MHICYIADARSPIAKNWIEYFVAGGHKVTVISSYPCKGNEIPGAHIIPFPLAFNSMVTLSSYGHLKAVRFTGARRILAETHTGGLSQIPEAARAWSAPLQIQRRKKLLERLLSDLRPDLVHAMRLPCEGFLAAAATDSVPLIVSIWGNDLTLFATRYRTLGKLTDFALARADGLFCDCARDLNLARVRGFSHLKPARVIPGGGGIKVDQYSVVQPDRHLLSRLGIPERVPLIINPRGFRTYVHNDTFFQAIPLVLREIPNAFFIAPGMAGNPIAERWIKKLDIGSSVRLLPVVSQCELAALFASSQVSVSLTSHDGTPNTLLEAMIYGAFPIAGDIESLREWILDGKNGLLCDSSNPEVLASCIIRALKDADLRCTAKQINRDLVRSRADYGTSMSQAEALYDEVLSARCMRPIMARSACKD